ncbi:MAG: PEGA domain-containing protein [Acidobacteria bacterium]|nr:PEGA domain-containing protein [Acidobacteriota bacterium]
MQSRWTTVNNRRIHLARRDASGHRDISHRSGRIAAEFRPLTRDDPTAFSPPAAFGPFRVLHQIGIGALGPIFRTYEPRRDRLVAVKAFRLDLTPEQAQELAAELQKIADLGLSHPALVAPAAAGVEGTTAYLAEEYVAAESLDVALRHYAPASFETALPFIRQLAEGIDFARKAGVHHGALHPRDIFVTPDQARASGFGVVAALERVGVRAPVRRPYSAPERIDGAQWASPADVFSLAAIAYELLTGRRIAGPGDVAGSVPGEGNPNVDGAAIAAVFAKALTPSPHRRYSTALGFCASLESAVRRRAPSVDGSTAPREPEYEPGVAGTDAPHDADATVPALQVRDEKVAEPASAIGFPPESSPDWIDSPEEASDDLTVRKSRADAEPALNDDFTRFDVAADSSEEPAEIPIAFEVQASDAAPEVNLSDVEALSATIHPSDVDLDTADLSGEPASARPGPEAPSDENATVRHRAPAPVDSSEPPLVIGRRRPPVIAPATLFDDASAPAAADTVGTAGAGERDAEMAEFDGAIANDVAVEPADDETIEVPVDRAVRQDHAAGEAAREEMLASPPRVDRSPPARERPMRYEPYLGPVAPEATPGWSGRALAAAVVGGILVGFLLGLGVSRWQLPMSPLPSRGSATATPSSDREWSETTVAESRAPRAPAEIPATRRPPAPAPSTTPRSARPAALTPVKAPQPRGRLLIRSTPVGSRVFTNGELKGVTPLALVDLPYGTYNVAVTKAGYMSERRRIVVSGTQPVASVQVRLAALAPAVPPTRLGSVFVHSDPPGARVFVDDRSIGATPVMLPDLSPGVHTIRLELPGYAPWSSPVRIAPGTRARVTASLSRR